MKVKEIANKVIMEFVELTRFEKDSGAIMKMKYTDKVTGKFYFELAYDDGKIMQSEIYPAGTEISNLSVLYLHNLYKI